MTTTTPVQKAACWLATTPEGQKPHPIIPALRQQFGLSTGEAIEAIRESNSNKARVI